MESMEEEKEEERMEESKEVRTRMGEEHMYGAKEETQNKTKEKEKED